MIWLKIGQYPIRKQPESWHQDRLPLLLWKLNQGTWLKVADDLSATKSIWHERSLARKHPWKRKLGGQEKQDHFWQGRIEVEDTLGIGWIKNKMFCLTKNTPFSKCQECQDLVRNSFTTKLFANCRFSQIKQFRQKWLKIGLSATYLSAPVGGSVSFGILCPLYPTGSSIMCFVAARHQLLMWEKDFIESRHQPTFPHKPSLQINHRLGLYQSDRFF